MNKRIVIIDDEAGMRSLLNDFFVGRGYDVQTFLSASEVVSLASSAKLETDLIITDINMPGVNGLEFCAWFQKAKPEIPIIVMTAYGSIETAIEAMRSGAFHYLVKPFKLGEVDVHVTRAFDHRKLHIDNASLRQQLKGSWSLGKIIGKSAGLRAVFELVDRVAQTTSNVLITGESGTGKEMFAREIHQRGPRASQPFVAINCGAIPEALLESELFGHAKGAFTGAIQRKRGLIEEADGGTLFLDEIGDMNVLLQTKVLRAIQDKKVRAVGENTDKEINVRIIAATHQDLKVAIKEGLFREDLYFRLSVIPVVIPALRYRKDDIPILAEHFLKKYSAICNPRVTGISKEALIKLTSFSWPGNVRELENVIERMVVLAKNSLLEESDIPPAGDISAEDFLLGLSAHTSPTLEQLEKLYIKLILEKVGDRKDRAAQILGVSRRTLYRKEKEFGLIEGKAGAEDYDADQLDSETSVKNK